jgi:hypothetical protein
VTLIPAVSRTDMFLGEFFLYRLLASPIVIVWFTFSRLFARFGRAKRLTLYALLIEVATFVLMVALFVFAFMSHSNSERRLARPHSFQPSVVVV